MLIRSQDRESIINFNNVVSIDVIGYKKTSNGYFEDYDNANVWKMTYSTDKNILHFGEYSTKEKAIKVLDMITDIYVGACYTDAEFDGSCMHAVVIKNNVAIRMPKDEEVEG